MLTRTETLEPVRRPLTPAETRVLRAKAADIAGRSRRAPRSALFAGMGVFATLWLLTLLASDASWLVVSAFWAVVGGGITLWVRRDIRQEGRQLAEVAQGLESALRRNAADVYDIQAKAFAELEEIEDEGAFYAFELQAGRLVFITGQEFYDGARFPSLDFSLVYILDERGRTVDMLIDKRGPKARPARTIPRELKHELAVPDHLQVMNGTLAELERLLRPAS